MTKFEELKDLFTEICDEKNELKESCVKFTSNIFNGLEDYLGIKERNELLFFESDSDCSNDEETKSLWNVMNLEQDNYWHFLLKLTIFHRTSMKWLSLCFEIGVKPDGTKFILSFFNNNESVKEFTLNPTNEENFLSFYEYIYIILKEEVEGFKYPLDLENKSKDHYRFIHYQ